MVALNRNTNEPKIYEVSKEVTFGYTPTLLFVNVFIKAVFA
jgi:hypothetical protein